MNVSFRAPGGGRFAPLALLFILVASLHLPALRAPFVGDDFEILDGVGFRSLPGALLAPDPQGNAFRPVGRQLHFWFVTHLGGGSPVAAHAANLALFLIALGLLAWVARRLVGPYAATITVALVGLSYAADVPVLWASGGQELIALAGALGSIALYLAGARVAAALLLFLGLLSHEAVVLAPMIAVVAARRPRELFRDSVQRGWPLYAAVGLWGMLCLGALSRHEFSVKPGPFGWDQVPAAFVHLLQVMIGLEWKARVGPRLHIAWYAIAVVGLATLAVGWASARRRQSRSSTSSYSDRSGPRSLVVGLLWVVVGTLPVVLTAATWSAHGYLFALCGLALLVSAWAARQARWVGPGLVAVLALCSQNTRRLDGVATGRNPWAPQSHLNCFALDQDMRPVSHYVAELKRLRPRLPRGSILFFARVPHFWEAGGGRLVRWAYRDSSLRAYDLSMFSMERARRGSAFFFRLTRDTLREIRPADLRNIAVNTLRRGRSSGPAREALMYAAESDPDDWMSRYWLAWIEWSGGDTTAALQHLERLGMRSNQPFEWSGSWAEKTLAAGDSAKTIDLLLKAVRHQPLSYDLHRRMAQLAQVRPGYEALGDVEAFAARVLARRPPPRRS